jgi:hypothetical protein
LRPEILQVVVPAEFNRDEMIDLAATGFTTLCIFRIYSVAHFFGHVPMLARPARRAHLGCRNPRETSPGVNLESGNTAWSGS